MSAYPHYRDSGVEWLGEVPEHWEVSRIAAVARHSTDSFTDGDWVELPYITDSGIRLIQTGNIGVGTYREQGFRYIDESSFDELRCSEIDPGDVLICRLAGPVGRACLAPNLGVRMITSVDVCILKPSEQFSADYIVYLLSSKPYLDFVESLVRGGTRDRISRSMLGAINIANPPLDEQRAIAAYLDRETERIDALVAKKRLLIERLEEYRSALITRTVTRGLPPEAARAAGLDPSPRLKPSGVEWLGEVPEHWDVKEIKWETPVLRGASPRPIDDEAYFDEDGSHGWVRIADVTAAGMYLERTTQRLSKLGISLSVPLSPGELFLSIAGSVGKPCITNIPCCIHDGFVYFPRWPGDTRFLYYVFASGEPYRGLGKLGTQLNLNTDTVGAIHIGVPPIPEQAAIADYATTAIAHRFVTECVVARPPSGLRPLSLEAYDELIALVALITGWGLDSDAIKYGLADTQLAVLESGRLGRSTTEYETAVEGYAGRARAEQIMRSSSAFSSMFQSPADPDPDPPIPASEFDAATKAEFGISIAQIAEFIETLLEIGDEQSGPTKRLPLAEARERVASRLAWSDGEVDAAFSLLTLMPRADFLTPPTGFDRRDLYPWAIADKRIERRSGQPLGDIDVLVANRSSKEILLVETKDFSSARTPAEFANEEKKLRKTLATHGERFEWLQGNLRDTLRWLGVDHGARDEWRVRQLVVVSSEVFTTGLRELPVPVATIAELRHELGTGNDASPNDSAA